LLSKQAQSDDDEAGETVALNMAASGDKFMEEFFEQVRLYAALAFVFWTKEPIKLGASRLTLEGPTVY